MIPFQLKKPKKQKTWDWLAAANFIIGGTGVGFYLVSFFKALVKVGSASFFESLPFGLISPLLISIGFLFLGVEAGRPLKGCFAFRHPRHSWISRETIAFCIFIPLALLDLLMPHPSIRLLAVIAALGLLISQGFIVYRARAVTAWNVPIIPIFFITSSLASGYGLLLLLMALGGLYPDQRMTIIGFIFAGLNLVIWFVYLFGSRSTPFFSATQMLRRSHSLILTVGLGHIIPLLLLSLLLIPQRFMVEPLLCFFAAISGALLFIGGAGQKAGIILSTGYFREMKLRR
jgi:phenylacetyl-CoA:acceptor oxidoreductase subunit 2